MKSPLNHRNNEQVCTLALNLVNSDQSIRSQTENKIVNISASDNGMPRQMYPDNKQVMQ